MGILVGGGFSVSNYLQGDMGPRRIDHLVPARKILRVPQA